MALSSMTTTTTTIKTHESDQPAVGLRETVCGICRKQISRYTCPSCNIFYCSLKCFRSEPHSQCSEIFYRKEIEEDTELRSSKTETGRIIELLKRVEDQGAMDGDALSHPFEEDEEDDLAHRVSAINISSASADELLRVLTKKERDKFFVALKDPSSPIIQDLLESVELEKARQLPWWDAPGEGSISSLSLRVPYGIKPNLMMIPTGLINQPSRSFSLLYNICAVLFAYTYVTRHLAMSPLSSKTNDRQDQSEARKMISQSVPFLIDRRSKMLHTSLTDAVLSFWSRLDPGSIDNETMSVLLEDVAKLTRPQRIIVAKYASEQQDGTTISAADHPSETAIMAISDLCSLFGNRVDPCGRTHIVMKLTFYAANILSTPSSYLHALADEISLLSKARAKQQH